MFYKNWYDIKYISDLITAPKWKNLEEIHSEYRLKPGFLEYLGILSSIPKDWRKLLLSDDEFVDEISYNIDRICTLKKANKVIYSELTHRDFMPPTGS